MKRAAVDGEAMMLTHAEVRSETQFSWGEVMQLDLGRNRVHPIVLLGSLTAVLGSTAPVRAQVPPPNQPSWQPAPQNSSAPPPSQPSWQPAPQNPPVAGPQSGPGPAANGAAPPPVYTAPWASPVPPGAAVPLYCMPACREGFICMGGMCYSACNPPCGAGEVCTQEARCVASSDQVDERARIQTASDRRTREAARLKHRLTLLGGMGINYMLDGKVMGMAVAQATVGYRKNFSTEGGIAVRVGIGGGPVTTSNSDSSSSRNSSSSSDSTTGMIKFQGELVAYLSPGRFYFGPLVWGGHYAFGKSTLIDANDHVYVLSDAWKGGAGIDMGILIGAREQFDINWSLKTGFSNQLPAVFDFGVGWHFI
jgi:hypothetical protein